MFRSGNSTLGVAIAHDLYRNIVNIDVYTEFELLEVKVPIIFLGTAGFSPRRDVNKANSSIQGRVLHRTSHSQYSSWGSQQNTEMGRAFPLTPEPVYDQKKILSHPNLDSTSTYVHFRTGERTI